MENKFINRYNTFCRCLENLKKSQKADPEADFVLEGTVQNFNLAFDISWKVMKDILVKNMGITDFAIGSPREVLKTAYVTMMLTITEQRRLECFCFKMGLLFYQPNQVRCISAILASNLLICKCVFR